MNCKNFILLLAVAGALFTTAKPAAAQNWVARVVQPEKNQPSSPYGYYWTLTSVACSADGTKIVAGAGLGASGVIGGPVCLSTNLGATWQVAALPTDVYWGGVAASADGTKMAAVGGASLYTSSDTGATWTPQKVAPVSGPGFGNATGLYCIASSADGTKLVAGFDEGNTIPTNSGYEGICLSADSGASWYASTLPGLWAAVASSADGNTLAALGTPLGAGQRSLYVSTDAGGSWRPANLPAGLFTFIALSGDGSTMVASGTNVFTSTDAGNTWKYWTNAPLGTSGTVHWTAPAASANGKKLMVGAFGGGVGTIYTSADTGATWQSTNNAVAGAGGFLSASASSADGRELVVIPSGEVYAFTLQVPLVSTISATPPRVQLSNTVSVVVTVINNSSTSVTNVEVDGSIAVAGDGGVSPAGFSGPTLAPTLAPGAAASFTYLYTATNYGTVNFTASASSTGLYGVVTSPPSTSGDVIIAPKADLQVKTADTNDTTFEGVGEFQQVPFNDQNLTQRIGTNGAAGYVVRLENDVATARTFVLRAATNSFTNWNLQVLSGNANILNALTGANGWTTPPLAPGADLDLQVSLAPLAGASVLENKSVLLQVLADSTSTDILDAVLLHAMLVPVPVTVTLHALTETGLTYTSIQSGNSDINAPLEPSPNPSLLDLQPEIHGGLVADGVTPLVIKLAADPANLAQFAQGRDFLFQAGILGGGALNGLELTNRFLLLQNGAWQTATDVVLTAASPNAYVELLPVLSDDVVLTAQPPELDVDFSVTDNSSGVQAGDAQFALRKPPIALLHGYNTTGDWGAAFKTILGASRVWDEGNSNNNFVCTVKYGQNTVPTPGLPSYTGQPVYVNTVASLDDCAQMASAAFNQAMEPLHSAWAFTRFDVVAHSQGGLLTRMLCSANINSVVSEPFRNAGNFYRGRFHRVVTIGSPHNGTRLLHYLLKLNQLKGLNTVGTLPQWVGSLGVASQIAQAKFDPFGPQIAEINNPSPSAPWYPDAGASFHLVAPVIDDGASPASGDTTLSYIALGLALPGGGAAVIPRGSDGVVDFDSLADNVPPSTIPNNVFLLPPVNDVSHSEPVAIFGAVATETTSTAVAQHVIDALDQNPALPAADLVFGSFTLPPALDPEVETQIDNYASSSTFSNIVGALLLLPQTLDIGSTYQYQLVFPTNLAPQGQVTWFVQVYGPDGITTDGVTLSSQGTNNSQVTVTVDRALVGDVVLGGTYVSTNNTVVTLAPTLVVSLSSSGATVTGVQVLPGNIALPIGAIISPQVVADYSDGSSSLRYVTPDAVAVTSSQPSVVSVKDPLNWQLSTVGTAKVTLSWSGFKTVSQITVFDPATNAPPTLSLINAGNGQLTLSWPGFTTSWVPESTPDLRKTNSWQALPASPVSAGGFTTVALPVTNSAQFYRLQSEP